ncbi:MAG: M20/M25/M40 family metallo-hydrolase [Herminiimonas sp.]|nr:M20/M25/M40 family metallo-hydrolase [Herminiimonas sp.]
MTRLYRFRLSPLATAFSLMLTLPATGSAATADTQAHQPQIDRIVAAISAQRIEAYIQKLVSFHTRHTASDTVSDTIGIGAARRWIKGELERCGAAAGGRLQVGLDSYVQPAGPRLAAPTEIVNVVATLPGAQKESKERLYVVSGHYDSIDGDQLDVKGFAPGANDDASGTAAVMEMACVMAGHSFDATLVFLTVAGEEQGLFGSTHWAEGARQKNLNIAGMFTNDIIGSSRADDGRVDGTQVRLFAEGVPALKEMPDAVRMLLATGGENDSPTRQLARHVKEVGERYVPNFKVSVIQRRDRYLRGGDHMPFLERGYPALRFTEPNEDFRHQHQNVRIENYTQYGDLPQFVDPLYVARVASVNAAAMASLALAPAAPQKVQMKTSQLENDSTLVWSPNTEPDLLGYRVVWRETTAAQWQGALFVGNVTQTTMKGLSKDNYFFGVQAVDKDGNASVATYPVPLR